MLLKSPNRDESGAYRYISPASDQIETRLSGTSGNSECLIDMRGRA